MSGDCCVFKFLRRSVDGKHLLRFQSETSVFKFLRRSVDGVIQWAYQMWQYLGHRKFFCLSVSVRMSFFSEVHITDHRRLKCGLPWRGVFVCLVADCGSLGQCDRSVSWRKWRVCSRNRASFGVDEKHFESGAFRKRWRHDDHVISLPEFSSNTKCRVIAAFLNSSGVAWTGAKWESLRCAELKIIASLYSCESKECKPARKNNLNDSDT